VTRGSGILVNRVPLILRDEVPYYPIHELPTVDLLGNSWTLWLLVFEVRAKDLAPVGLSPVCSPRIAPGFGTRRRLASWPLGLLCEQTTHSMLGALLPVADATPAPPCG